MAETPKLAVKRGRPRNIDGRKVTKTGYVLVRLEYGNWVPEHRYNLEQLLGRKLRSTEQVRWVDGDHTNNDVRNLELWEPVRTYPR